MSDKIYVGIGRIVKTKYDPLLSLAFSKSDVEQLQANLRDGWVNMFVAKRKEAKDGKTHYGYILEKPVVDDGPERTTAPSKCDDDDLAF